MRRSFRTRVSFSGSIPRVCTLGWYAMPRRAHGIGNVADGLTSPVDEGRRTKNPCLVAQFEFNLSDRCFCSRLQAEFL